MNLENTSLHLEYETTHLTYVRDYLSAMNCFFKLTDVELTILAEFIQIYLQEITLTEDIETQWLKTFSSINKRLIADKYHYKRINIIDQHIFNLKRKKILNKEKRYITINNLALPKNELTIKFKRAI